MDPLTLETADWTRVAKPQSDRYDINVLRLTEPQWSPESILNDQWESTPQARLANCIDVRPERIQKNWEMFERADDVTSIQVDAMLLPWMTQWKDGWLSFSAFVDEIWAFRKIGVLGKGSMSGHHVMNDTLPIHAVYASFNDWPGCSQGLYHEFAHIRLRALGVAVENHDGRLLTNPNDELFNSSVRYDMKRPMSAVLHGFYAWVMYMENDWQNYNAGLHSIDDLRDYSYRNIAKLVNGWMEVQNYARWTPAGQLFWQSCSEWSEDLVTRMQYAFREQAVPQASWDYLAGERLTYKPYLPSGSCKTKA